MCALLLPDITSFIAAMLFSVHPIHTEAVSRFLFTLGTFNCRFFVIFLYDFIPFTILILKGPF